MNRRPRPRPRLRRARLLAAALVLPLVAVVDAPASASTSAAAFTGEVVGDLAFDPGIPAAGCLVNDYTLAARVVVQRAKSTTTTETSASAGLDQLNLWINGLTNECTTEGRGSAFAMCRTAAALGTDVVVPDGPNDVLLPTAAACDLNGSSTRVGNVMTLRLFGDVTVTDASTGDRRRFAINLDVTLVLAPNFARACGSTQCVTSAIATGTLVGTTSHMSPVSETRAGIGNAVFSGTASLEKFPCAPGTTACNGTFSGDWTGHIMGTQGSSVYEITWSAPGGIGATFTYADWTCLAGVEVLVGFAQGQGSATAVPGQIQGKWQVPGESFARDIIGVAAVFDFTWSRAAAAAVITFEPAYMTVEVAGLGTKLVGTGPQFGPAVFAATHTDPIQGPPLCSTPLGHVEGRIAGAVTLDQVAA